MRYGGVLAQYATDSGADLDRVLRSAIGQILGFLLVVAFGFWMMLRSRANRANRPPVSGWYADPFGAPYQRWWNGSNWTGDVRQPPWPGPPGYGPPGYGPPPGAAGPWVPPPSQDPAQDPGPDQGGGPWTGA